MTTDYDDARHKITLITRWLLSLSYQDGVVGVVVSVYSCVCKAMFTVSQSRTAILLMVLATVVSLFDQPVPYQVDQ